ncbi:hypothetical protein ACT8ZV_23070 [Nocardioides sp. MAHUQ-72]|uniref:hypothetical protein n=1 Tax=unclassified Nocardioides TaxID=2615069 RepID=UPI00361D05F7
MEDLLRDLVIKFGGAWPYIGSILIAGAVLGWGTKKLVDMGLEPPWTLLVWFTAAGAVVCAILALAGVPTAQASCRQLWAQDRIEHLSSNCEMLVHCDSYNAVTCN